MIEIILALVAYGLAIVSLGFNLWNFIEVKRENRRRNKNDD